MPSFPHFKSEPVNVILPLSHHKVIRLNQQNPGRQEQKRMPDKYFFTQDKLKETKT